MIQRLFNRTLHINRLFSAVQGNARVVVITEGISGIFWPWSSTYLTLYMLALGVSEMDIGWLASLLILTQLIGTLFGGYAADRYGRKRVLVVTDIICWGVPFLLYAVAQNPWYFVAGRFVNGFIYIVMPAFECLFVEDVPSENRPAVFGMMQFLVAAAALSAPIAGWMVDRLGIIVAGRWIFGICCVVSVVIAIARQFTLVETTMGRERMAATATVAPMASIKEYLAAVMIMLRDPRLRKFLIVRNLVGFVGVMWGTYSVIFLADTKGIGLAKSAIAYLPVVSSIATLLMIFLAAEGFRSERIFQNLLIGQVLWLAGALFFVISPAGTIWFALLSTFISAISTALFTPASQSYWANIMGDEERAQVLSVGMTLLSIITLPAAPIAGALYLLWPRAPFLAACALQVVVLVMLVGIWRKEVESKRLTVNS
jgi:MFS transporter, DHA1 family, tetracycline resistance protein